MIKTNPSPGDCRLWIAISSARHRHRLTGMSLVERTRSQDEVGRILHTYRHKTAGQINADFSTFRTPLWHQYQEQV